jgi:hypothetical protein
MANSRNVLLAVAFVAGFASCRGYQTPPVELTRFQAHMNNHECAVVYNEGEFGGTMEEWLKTCEVMYGSLGKWETSEIQHRKVTRIGSYEMLDVGGIAACTNGKYEFEAIWHPGSKPPLKMVVIIVKDSRGAVVASFPQRAEKK